MQAEGTPTTMTELSGQLEGVGLPAIVRFLTGLRKTGCLHVAQGDWRGEVFFAAGQVTGSSLGGLRGLKALDALVQALPAGTFRFEALAQAVGAADIALSPEALQAHLDDLAARIATGAARLPAFDAVPQVVVRDDPGAGAEPLPLDRLMLLTLLAVDGQRTVREIVAHRGSIDALWQLGSLADVGLIQVPPDALASTAVTPVLSADVDRLQPAAVIEPPARRPIVLDVRPQDEASHCPKLGFEDDPRNSFARPTRLHRCFAAGTPLALSIDQQRELCLSDQFGTCPRLSMASPSGPARSGRDTQPVRSAPRPEPEPDDSRIVRLPFGGRGGASPRGGDRQAVGASELSHFRTPNAAPRDTDSPPPTPLRSRLDRANGAVSASDTDEAVAPEPVAVERKPARHPLVDDSESGRFRGVPVTAIAGIAIVLSVVAVIAYLLFPYLNDLFSDDSLDASVLPNTSAVAAGEPVSRLLTPQVTPVARATPGPGGAASVGEGPNAVGAVAASASPGAGTAPANASTTPGSAVAATVVAEPTPAPTAEPNDAAPVVPPAAGTLLDETFTSNALNWPSSPQGTAWLSAGGYRLIPRGIARFVAVGVPLADVPSDVIVTARFRKLSGPPGGGFGIILRDQGGVPRDGTSQDGHFYVLEVGDKGEIGIWRRDADHWVDLLPWQHSDAVHTGSGTNELTVSAVGDRLTMTVNGTEAATRTDAELPTGGVGLFTGGDGNQVVVDHLSVQTP